MKVNSIYFCYTLSVLCSMLSVSSATAYEYNNGRYGMKLTGFGTVGVFESDLKENAFINDWLVRSQFNYAVSANKTIGLVYALDELATYQDRYARDAFLFLEDSKTGRIEIGFTDSIATKLGVGLPDVGGLRVNDNPIFYKEIEPTGPVISNTTLTSGRYSLRTNFVSVPTRPLQFGASFSGPSSKYNSATDIGIKYRRPDGKTKTAFSFGASFIDSPENLQTEVFTQNVTADWRAQVSTGVNLQYNSWVWGISARGIYDKNPIGLHVDGISAGTGVSYDLLNYSLSVSYLFSDTGVWNNTPDYTTHTGIFSFRYKYNENIDGWISTGISTDTQFISGGIRAKF